MQLACAQSPIAPEDMSVFVSTSHHFIDKCWIGRRMRSIRLGAWRVDQDDEFLAGPPIEIVLLDAILALAKAHLPHAVYVLTSRLGGWGRAPRCIRSCRKLSVRLGKKTASEAISIDYKRHLVKRKGLSGWTC